MLECTASERVRVIRKIHFEDQVTTGSDLTSHGPILAFPLRITYVVKLSD